MKKIPLPLLTVFLLLLALPALADTTVMLYMCGTDLQSACLEDIEEMCRAELGDEVRLTVLAGGAKEWDDDRFSGGRLNLFSIDSRGMSEITPWGKGNMGDPATLVSFVQYARRNSPAEQTMLIFWDHGGGSQYGMCFDEVYDDDCLTLSEIDQAFAALRRADPDFRLNIVGMDACLMAGFEVAAVCAPYADYLVASQELEPGIGWHYTPWLNALAAQPAMDAESLCLSIVDAYCAACRAEDPNDSFTLSAVRLSAMEPLTAAIEELAAGLSDALESGRLNTISRMHSRMHIFGSFADQASDMVDLQAVIELGAQFNPEAAQKAAYALSKAVLVSGVSPSVPTACGLSAFLPLNDREYLDEILPGYQADGKYPGYTAFITDYAQRALGGGYVFAASAPAQVDQATLDSAAFAQSAAEIGFIPGEIQFSSLPAWEPTQPPFIAGSAPGAAPAATPAPGQAADSAPGFIAGSASAYVEPPTITADSLAFSLTLSADAMENLNYVEGMLLMDLSDEDGVFLVDMGYLQNSWIDWTARTVYSMFDGEWPMLNSQFVTMYDQSVTQAVRRSLIPALVNGEETFLVVSFEAGSKTGRILGHNAGYDERGLPIRGVTKLAEGDIITPRYTLYYCLNDALDSDEEMQTEVYDGDSFAWADGMEVVYGSLRDESDPTVYQFEFVLNDIFGDFEISDPISFTL